VARERHLIQRWGVDLHAELTHLNELDIRLYEQACDEIRRRLSLIPAVPDRIAEFGTRCEELAVGQAI
jgi:hypothetical protein